MSLPVIVDPSSKVISVDGTFIDGLTEESKNDLSEKLAQLNVLSQYVVGLNGAIPPPPNTISKQFTDQVAKLRTSGLMATRGGKHQEALKFYTLALQFALKRPFWESARYVIEEACGLLLLRTDTYIALNMWPEAYTDSSLVSLLVPMDGNGRYRRGRCLQTIGKYVEARNEYLTALAVLPGDSSIKTSLGEVEALLAKA